MRHEQSAPMCHQAWVLFKASFEYASWPHCVRFIPLRAYVYLLTDGSKIPRVAAGDGCVQAGGACVPLPQAGLS